MYHCMKPSFMFPSFEESLTVDTQTRQFSIMLHGKMLPFTSVATMGKLLEYF